MDAKPRRDRRGYLQPNRRNKFRPQAYFGIEVHSAISCIAASEGVRIQDFIAEALRDIFNKHGVNLPSELQQKVPKTKLLSGALRVLRG